MTQTHATAYAVVLGSAEHGFSLATLCKTPECAREAVSIFEGMPVLGLATIALEPEPIIGMAYRLRGGAVPAPHTAPLTATPSAQAGEVPEVLRQALAEALCWPCVDRQRLGSRLCSWTCREPVQRLQLSWEPRVHRQ